ncbi:MAG: hypothetical protein KDA58_12185 [Planctomycetaceae bacterium]|nr:hypothetical protein [Planctomycetaceae bacterium]
MNDDSELQKFKFVLIAGIFFLVSAWYAAQELRYAVFSTRTDAVVNETRIEIVKERRGRRIKRTVEVPKLAISYQYADASGSTVHGEAMADPDANFEPGQTIAVQYLDGVDDSERIVALTSLWSVYAFLGSLAVMGYFIWQMAREANAPIPTSRRR